VLRASGRTLLLCGMRDQPARMMERAEFHQHIGDPNLAPTIEAALSRARSLLASA
jgi:SulP family sulfate permease